MPDDPIAAQIADRHVTTDAALIVVPIVNVKTAPIVIAIVITAVGSDTDVKLSECDRGFGRNVASVFGECRENPRRARNGGDKRQFSHSNTPPCLVTLRSEVNKKDRLLVQRHALQVCSLCQMPLCPIGVELSP